MKKVLIVLAGLLVITGCNKNSDVDKKEDVLSCYVDNNDSSVGVVRREVQNYVFSGENNTLSKIYYDEVHTIQDFASHSDEEKESERINYKTNWCGENFNADDSATILSKCDANITKEGITISMVYKKSYVDEMAKFDEFKSKDAAYEKLQKSGLKCEK